MGATHLHALTAAAVALPAALTAVTAPVPARAADADAVPILHTSHAFPRGYMEYQASAGQTITDTVTVVNAGQAAGTFNLFAADGVTSQVTGVVYADESNPFPDGPSGNGEYGAGSWLTLSASSAQLAPGQSVAVTMTVNVPPAAAPGDWVGSVSAENPVPSRSGGQFSFNVTTRVTIAVVVHVPGAVNLDAVSLGTPFITVENRTRQILNVPLQYMGDVLVKPLVNLRLLDSRGRVLFRIDRQLDTFVPHTTLIYPIPLDSIVIDPGNYTLVVDFGPTGAEQHFVRDFTVTSGQANVPPPSRRGHPPAVPNPLLWLNALLPVAVVALLILLVLRRRRRCAHCDRPWRGGGVAVSGVAEVRTCVRCSGSLSRRGTRVRLCPDCLAGHRGWNKVPGKPAVREVMRR